MNRFKDNLENDDNEEGVRRNLGNLISLKTGNKTLNPFYNLIRTNSFLGGKVYFRVVGEQIPVGH